MDEGIDARQAGPAGNGVLLGGYFVGLCLVSAAMFYRSAQRAA